MPWRVPYPSHAARTVPLILGGCSRDPGVVPWRAVGRRSTRVATGPRRPRRGACRCRPCVLHDAERRHASASWDNVGALERRSCLSRGHSHTDPGSTRLHTLLAEPRAACSPAACCYCPAPPRGCACVGQRSRAKPGASASACASTARKRSCPSSLRLNTRGLHGDRHRSKKASTIGPTWRHSGPLHRDDALDAGRADTRRLLRPPSLAPSHHHSVLTDPLAGATAARERVVPLSRSRRDRSGPRPSPASEAATAWPSPCHGWVPAAAEAAGHWREAGRNYMSLSRFNHQLTKCEGHPARLKGAAACHLACNAASNEGTRCCTSSTGTPVISRNASGTAGPCTVYLPSRGSPSLGGIVDHKSE
jgi:hypothetical protein